MTATRFGNESEVTPLAGNGRSSPGFSVSGYPVSGLPVEESQALPPRWHGVEEPVNKIRRICDTQEDLVGYLTAGAVFQRSFATRRDAEDWQRDLGSRNRPGRNKEVRRSDNQSEYFGPGHNDGVRRSDNQSDHLGPWFGLTDEVGFRMLVCDAAVLQALVGDGALHVKTFSLLGAAEAWQKAAGNIPSKMSVGPHGDGRKNVMG